MNLKDRLSKKKAIEADFPDMSGFKVHLNYLSREELQKIRDKCKIIKINKRTREPEEEVNSELFTKLYVDAVISGWDGLKMQYLKELVVLEGYKDSEADDLVPYSKENAQELMGASVLFDSWVSEMMNDVANFNKDS